MTKPATTQLKNDLLSFWSFLAVIVTNALNMDWTEFVQFNIGGILTRNILEHFARMCLDTSVQATTTRRNGNYIALSRQMHNSRAMFSYFLNTEE